MPRTKFSNQQDWQDYVDTKTNTNDGTVDISQLAMRDLRNACYLDIEELRSRPLLVYASNFLSSVSSSAPISIDLSDVDGFTDMINSIPSVHQEVDLLIQSPGGAPDATHRLVGLLRKRFNEVHFLVPHSAYSAATMLSMSGNTITLHNSGVLGPIDPQLNGIPARQIKRAFVNIQKQVINEGQESIIVYLPLIQKYTLPLLEACDDAEKLSKDLVKDWIKSYMLVDEPDRAVRNRIAKNATEYMADFDKHRMHSLALDIDRLKGYGIKVDYADDDLGALLREAHILLKATFEGFEFTKLYESPNRQSWGVRITKHQ